MRLVSGVSMTTVELNLCLEHVLGRKPFFELIGFHKFRPLSSILLISQTKVSQLLMLVFAIHLPSMFVRFYNFDMELVCHIMLSLGQHRVNVAGTTVDKFDVSTESVDIFDLVNCVRRKSILTKDPDFTTR